jgi:hypothetical protein
VRLTTRLGWANMELSEKGYLSVKKKDENKNQFYNQGQ